MHNSIQSKEHIQIADHGAALVHKLIESYKLLPELEIVPTKPASYKELRIFHQKAYVDFLRKANKLDCSKDDDFEKQMDEFNLGYDCPLLPRMFNFVRVIAGASLQAANVLVTGQSKCAINWCGGWHHAQSSEAQGFCYVNDVVLAIHKLLKRFKKVFYIDLDVHHGNGVENAFKADSRVITFSLHLYEPGFFPCSGSSEDVGEGEAKYYTINAPMKPGLSDSGLMLVFRCVESAVAAFNPDAIVVQCGADTLNKDPLGGFSLTLSGVGECIKTVLSWELPTLFLGGGGYNPANAARLWTYLTSLIVKKPISNDIPAHQYFLEYGNGYSHELHISPGQREDENTLEYLQTVVKTIEGNLQFIKSS